MTRLDNDTDRDRDERPNVGGNFWRGFRIGLVISLVLWFLFFAGVYKACAQTGTIIWNGPKPIVQTGGNCTPTMQPCLGTASVIRQTYGSPHSGPQALEGYTIVDTSEVVRLAMGTIGNVEIAGSGDVTEVRALQGGIVISGPSHIQRASVLTLPDPARMAPYTGPLNIDEVDYVQFGNGASIRPATNGKGLDLCDPYGNCISMLVWH